MFCPNCGQERVSVATNFCSRCGYLLTGTADLLQHGGTLPRNDSRTLKHTSPRKRGIKQGLFIFLLTFLVVPVVGIFTLAINVEPFAVGIAAVTLFVGGLLRIVYAFMFESAEMFDHNERDDYIAAAANMLKANPTSRSLPPTRSEPIGADIQFRAATGSWRETSDLEPHSVTEGTTRLLDSEEMPPHGN